MPDVLSGDWLKTRTPKYLSCTKRAMAKRAACHSSTGSQSAGPKAFMVRRRTSNDLREARTAQTIEVGSCVCVCVREPNCNAFEDVPVLLPRLCSSAYLYLFVWRLVQNMFLNSLVFLPPFNLNPP